MKTRTPVIITGGAGYIGSHIVELLGRDDRFDIHVIDNLSSGRRDAVLAGTLHEFDIRDTCRLDQLFADVKPAAVMHFAAKIEVGESVQHPSRFFSMNTGATLDLLDAMVRANIPRFIFSSTAAVYGEPEEVPITEDAPLAPTNPYGTSKSLVERALADITAHTDLEAVSLRYFNAAGADPDGRIGENHDPETHLIPLVLQAAAGIRKNIKIFGTDYETPDGTCIRDYVHVCDLAAAHVAALDYLLDGGTTTACNLGYGTGTSVREIIETAKRVTGIDFPVVEVERRPGDPARLVASSQRARTVLGWEPVLDDLNAIVKHAWQWMNTR